jgi:glycosyltransferase involved in cell wall biosynthesis
MKALGIIWAQWGPYHFARLRGLRSSVTRTKVHGIELSNLTRSYGWSRGDCGTDVITLCPDAIAEQLPFRTTFRRMRRKIAELGIGVCLLPSYSPKQSLAALLAAKSLGTRTVMMNETHAGTVRARGLATLVKRQLVCMFDAALVGGAPQRRYFASLGLPLERIFVAYDAVDNDYFAQKTKDIRNQRSEVRDRYSLPEHYFLSLGRFVAKKNLETLIRAYRQYLDTAPLKQTHLVMVGSGEEGTRLKWLCHNLGLPVYEKSALRIRSAECGVRNGKEVGGRTETGGQGNEIANRKSQIANAKPGVHFYGFRQIEENPVFYALADAFILPSLWEEWGLVVNEAMASGLPVVVSKTAGCAEDLLEAGSPWNYNQSPGSSRARELGVEEHLRQNGLVFDPKSSEELSRMLLLLESSADLRSAMGQAGRRVVSRFSCEKFGENALRASEAALARQG